MIQLLGPIANIATTWLEGKKEKAKAKQQLEVAKVQAQVKKVEQDGSWEEKAIDASDNSWKDEAWTIIPALQPYISDGFKFLREDCPDWLSYGILASIAASFGLKSIAKLKK